MEHRLIQSNVSLTPKSAGSHPKTGRTRSCSTSLSLQTAFWAVYVNYSSNFLMFFLFLFECPGAGRLREAFKHMVLSLGFIFICGIYSENIFCGCYLLTPDDWEFLEGLSFTKFMTSAFKKNKWISRLLPQIKI